MPDTATLDKDKAGQQPAPAPEPPEPKLPALRGGGGIKAIIPQNFEEAYKMARIIAASGTAPKSYMMKDPTDLREYLSVERIAVAIMHGLEVGLPPMQAVQGIAVINGMPTVYGDARDALVEASALLEDRVEEHELDDQGLFLWWRCTVWRKGRKTPIVQTVTRPQAQRAGWLKKTGPWTESPNRMAQQRARGWAYRDAFPDVLKGLVDRDEALDMVDVTAAGNATTTPPPEPRRSDFRAPPAVQVDEGTTDNEPEPEGWPLCDETGETVGRYGSPEWAERLEDAAGKLQGAECARLLENNADTANQLWESDATDPVIASDLRKLYELAPQKKSWKIADDIVGQEPRRKAILELLELTETERDVDDLQAEHKEFIDKLGRLRAETLARIRDRKAVLGKGGGK